MRLFRLQPTTVVSLVALFVVLGGTGYAAIKLPANSVGTKQLKKNAVTLKKIKKSTRKRLKGQKGAPGPTGATGSQGATGATGPRGATGAPGPGAIKLDLATTVPPDKTTTLYSRDGLSITAACKDVAGNSEASVELRFGASGVNATANVSWTQEFSGTPTTTATNQDGVANGTVTVATSTSFDLDPGEFFRLEGQAVLRGDTRAVSVAFHAFVGDKRCKVDGTATPAT